MLEWRIDTLASHWATSNTCTMIHDACSVLILDSNHSALFPLLDCEQTPWKQRGT